MIKFTLAATPRLLFGAGKVGVLPATAKDFGAIVLLVTGARSFISSSTGQRILDQFKSEGSQVEMVQIMHEPSPQMIDAAVSQYASYKPDCVVAIGGGSVLDAGKAISAMLPIGGEVKDYLEGVGTKPSHPGVKVPFIAVPTTAGTGSEATKNAVLSETGDHGYKRSLRHDRFVPDLAIIDPELTLHCPPQTTAASGMDAFTQLLESYLSTDSNPITDALALEGLRQISRSMFPAFRDGSDLDARTGMALGAYLSGVTLANAGLGLVHGFSSSVGGYFNIPHGVICSALMAPVNRITVRKLREEHSNDPALKKYATVGRIFAGSWDKADDYYTDLLLSRIEELTNEMAIPRLSAYGVSPAHFEKVIAETRNKNNPVDFIHEEMLEALESATF